MPEQSTSAPIVGPFDLSLSSVLAKDAFRQSVLQDPTVSSHAWTDGMFSHNVQRQYGIVGKLDQLGKFPCTPSWTAACDAMRLLQTASAINDHTLVTVARRKHVFAVQVLQDELEHGTIDYDTMINAGFGILLCEVLLAPHHQLL